MIKIAIRYLIPLISIAGGILTIWLFSVDQYGRLSNDGRWGIFFLGAFAAFVYGDNILLKKKFERSYRYGEALHTMSEIYTRIYELNRISNPAREKIIHECENLCSSLSFIFLRITDTPCAVCIKYISFGSQDSEKKYEITTLCRDAHSSHERAYSDKNDHWINENTDFAHIFERLETPQQDFFFSHCLPLRREYKNSSFKIWGQPSSNRIIRYLCWPLPYRSTIVVPIRLGISEEGVKQSEKVVGFLCVDSPRSHTFKKPDDVEFMSSVASGLYGLLCKFNRGC